MVDLQISDELKQHVSGIEYINDKALKIVFTAVHNNIVVHCRFAVEDIQKCLKNMEAKLKQVVENISFDLLIRIENAVYDNLALFKEKIESSKLLKRKKLFT